MAKGYIKAVITDVDAYDINVNPVDRLEVNIGNDYFVIHFDENDHYAETQGTLMDIFSDGEPHQVSEHKGLSILVKSEKKPHYVEIPFYKIIQIAEANPDEEVAE